MSNFKDVMIDFETLGNGTHKCICQVGAVYFDSVTGELGREIKYTIDASSHEKYGGKIDAKTVYWWLAQSDEARASITVAEKTDIKVAFEGLNEFLTDAKRIWSHATFDFVTLMETMKQLDIKPSFGYKAGLDIRTLVYLAGTSVDKTVRDSVHHDGLEDAKHQVKYTVAALNRLKRNKNFLKLVESFNE